MTVLNQRKRISAEDNTIVKNIEMTLAENNDIVLKFYKQNYIDELSEEEISTFNISLGEYYKKSYIDDSFYTKSELDTKFDSLVGFTVSIVSELPSTGENGVMYLVPSADGETGNTYIEYIWVDNKFEKIGDTTTKVNLTDYYTKAQVDTQISTQIQNYHLGPFRDELTNKADKIHTHEDATISKSGFMSASDKSKLDSLNESGDITIDTSLSLTSGNPVSNRVITQALNGKASTDAVSTSLNGLMSKDDKIKLDGIDDGANKTVVDSSLSSSSINPVQNKVVKDALDGKANVQHNHTFATVINLQSALNGKADTSHTHDVATQNTNGFLSKEDKVKLDGIAEGANKTIVDSSLSSTSVNPVQSKIINSALNEKANVSHTHNIGDIDNLQSALDGKANTSHTHNDTYYTKDEINTRLGDIETILNEILGV